ncbi:hypothetical protein Tco_0322761 [Tanacetum coccineum]
MERHDTPGKESPAGVAFTFPIIPRFTTFVQEARHTAKDMIGMLRKVYGARQAYSMWPVILTTYNLPPWLCMKESNFMLTLLIPGPKSPGKDIDVYLRPLIGPCSFIGQEQVETTDMVSGQNFNMRAMFLRRPKCDFPARSSFTGWSGKSHHKWRSSREFNGDTDHRDPPKEYPRDVILAQHARLLTRVPGKTNLQKLLGIRRPLWLTKNHKGKIVKPQAAYSFTPENRKKFCQYIKGVKLPDGFGSCFKHKVTDNDTNITGLKSHDCHIMMQRLLPYGLQNYLPDNIAKPIIELSSLFKQLCSATLMEDDMLKASVKVVEILCELERIYPPAFFDIMIHLPIHLALEALEGGPIHPRWMFPFERFMKKLKGYVRNKAKPEGSIAEGYVAEEALTLSSHYFRDVTTKFNRLERNVDPPPPTCQFQAFRSVCNTIGLRSFPPFGAKEFNKARWYVLHNSPEIDTYRAQFQSLFPEKNMLEEFTGWFRTLICERHANNLQDPEVSTTSELFALANGPSRTPMSVNACVVDGVRYVVQSRDERRTTQNSGICAPGPDGEMSYGQLQEILEFKYLSFKVALFRVKWFDTRNNGRVKKLTFRNGMTQIIGSGEWWKNDQYILATQVKQVFYLEDPAKPNVKVVEHVNHKKFFNRGVIVVENEPDIIHLDNSSDLPPSTSGNDLDNVTFYIDLHIDGESTEVDAPPDIIDVPGEDDDISDDEDPLPHDLADSDVEDLINDDDGVEKMADVARAHGGDGGGEDPSRPPPTSFGCAGCFINRGKGKRKPNLGGVKAGRKTRERTRNQVLKDAVAANKGRPIEIGFEDRADNTVVPIGPYSTQWGNYFGEMIRGIPLYYPSGQKFDLRSHMESDAGHKFMAGHQLHWQKIYNGKKAALKERYWVPEEDGTYDLERLRRGRHSHISEVNWDAQLAFWNDPGNLARAAQNKQKRAKKQWATCRPRWAVDVASGGMSPGKESHSSYSRFTYPGRHVARGRKNVSTATSRRDTPDLSWGI